MSRPEAGIDSTESTPATSDSHVVNFLLGRADPLATALYFEREEYTFGDIDRAARTIAVHLRSVGCSKGDRVLLISGNSFFWVAAYLGTMRAGLVSVPLPPGTPAADLGHIVAATEPAAACVESGPAITHGSAFGDLHLVTDRRVDQSRARSRADLRDLLHRADATAAWFPSVG